MNVRKMSALALVLVLAVSLAACGKDLTPVYVQSVESLSNMGGIAPGDRFAGMVVSENVAEIRKDTDKTVEELLVREGDDVTEGQELFRYDMEQLQLALDKQNLELEKLKASIDSSAEQIAQLEKQLKNVWKASDKLQYTIQIQSLELDKKEAELNAKAKEKEIQRTAQLLENTAVLSPVTGRIQSISENGTDNYGNPLPYITIQQAGSYRVKGTIGELQRGGLSIGDRLRILSRTGDMVWYGTITLVDYENPTQGTGNEKYYGSSVDPMTNSSRYPFYVELESTEGLMLGQHVYLELDRDEEETPGVPIPGAFVVMEEDGSTYVWAENGRGKLEKRPVTLGEYNMMNDTYAVLEGLTGEDFVAFPDMELCVEGAPTNHELAVEEPMEGGGM